MSDSDQLEQHNLGHFGFSAVKIDDLGATEYTLVTIVCDRSYSTSGFQQDMERVLKEVIKACAHSPRADNLLVRVIVFDDQHVETHGFKLLEGINPDDYDGSLAPQGATALFDATLDAIEGTQNYAEQLAGQDFDCNGILFVITDGCDNRSTNGLNQIKSALQTVVRQEDLESLVSLLIGVNVNDQIVSRELQKFNQESGFTDYIELDNADKKTLAKLANFVSQSISSQSQALGTGGPSQSIKF